MKKKYSWGYKNTTLLIISVILVLFLADTEIAHILVRKIESYGYFGAAITGMFFVSTFTVVPASIALFHLAQDANPFLIALYGGAGSVLGDLLIFRFFRDGVFKELRALMPRRRSYLAALMRTKYFAWIVPVVGALIIISPFPDELGIAMMGLTRIKTWQFILLTFVLNVIGIFSIVTLAATL